ncbi:TIM barrel protein [Gracilibacillus salitolerans]|uniref:TIM barrel protein n=1 Tax=Gracilibacillus salitolerans TaxID=2663022 RepID=A0A5Q2TLN8_9BACI|nr:sugar phosphate isomerase/epimerase family protein [Gracilibacillus salitolerans]QGH35575.1 TIM barrel protein [Gracilibacillus salitolerans]
MKFSVFTVMTPDVTPAQVITYLKETGYDGVEWRFKETPNDIKQETPSFWRNNLCTISPDVTERELTDLLAWTKDYGLENTSVTPYLTAGDIAATERVLQVAQKLRASSIRVGVPKYNRSQNYHDLYQEGIRYLSEVEQMCKHYQVKGLVETHHNTITPSAALAYKLVHQFDPDYIGVLYDPGNMVKEGYENHRMGMELLGPYLAHVHVKNASWEIIGQQADGSTQWEANWCLLEKGVVDWQQVFSDLKAVGYDGYIGMEDFSGVLSTKASLQHNIDRIKAIITS